MKRNLQGRTRLGLRTVIVIAALSLMAALPAVASASIGGFNASDGTENNNGAATSTACSPPNADWVCPDVMSNLTSAAASVSTSGKEDQPNGWKSSSGGGSKGDILGAWSYSYLDAGNTQDDLALAFNRATGTGNTFVGFEINQNPEASNYVNATGATVPCRQDGDLLISYNFPSTSSPSITVYEWQWASGTVNPCSSSSSATGSWVAGATLSAPAAEFAANGLTATNYFNNGSPASFAPETFGEAAVNMPAVAQAVGLTGCEYFQSVHLTSRSSSSTSSNLNSYADGGPISAYACDQKAPCSTVTITSPTDGQSVSADPIAFAGGSSVANEIDIAEDGSSIVAGPVTPAAGGAWTANVKNPEDGKSHTYTAFDPATDSTTCPSSTKTITLTTGGGGAPPPPKCTLTISSPADGASNLPDTLTVSGSSTGGVGTVQLKDNGTTLPFSTTADTTTGAWSMQVTVADGSHAFTAFSSSCSGSAITTTSNTVNVTTTGGSTCSVAITSPANNSVVTDNPFLVSGTSSGGATEVDLYDGVTLVGSATPNSTTGNWSVSVANPRDGSSHTYFAMVPATKCSSSAKAASSNTVTVTENPPTPSGGGGGGGGTGGGGGGTGGGGGGGGGGLTSGSGFGGGGGTTTPTTTPTPKAALAGAALLACPASALAITDIFPQGRRVHIIGLGTPGMTGKTLQLISSWNGKVVARMLVRRDYSFSTFVPLPPAKVRSRAAYWVRLGVLKSPKIGFSRRLYNTYIHQHNARVRFTGLVTAPLARPRGMVTIVGAASCKGIAGGTVLKRVRVARNGKFTTSFVVPKSMRGLKFVFLRTSTVVYRPGKGHHKITVYGITRAVGLIG